MRLNTTENNFKVKIFYPVLDTILCQLISRFLDINDVLEDFSFLNTIILSTQTDENVMKAPYNFRLTYKNYINSDFPR